MQPVGIGIIGTGNISDAYLKAAPKFPVLKIVACADINMDAAQAKAATYGIEALTVDALLADPRISIVLNLTTPQHHVPVGLRAIAAGKHVVLGKAARHRTRRTASASSTPRAPKGCASAARPTPSSAARTRPHAKRSMPAPSASRLPAPPS